MDVRAVIRIIAVVLYQLHMILYCLLDLLRLNANIPLRGACAAMLQQPLHQRNIIAIIFINLRGVPFAEAVGADICIA